MLLVERSKDNKVCEVLTLAITLNRESAQQRAELQQTKSVVVLNFLGW
jgi:hypothetical protein